METVMKKVSELIPYEKNTKKHEKQQIDNVAESIQKFGFVQPVVIDKDNVIVIGHCRVLAAKKIGMKEVPCVSVDKLTPEQVNALRIVDNKTNESEWDFDFLAEELSEIDLSGFDFDFDFPEVEAEKEDQEENDIDSDSEENENPYTMNINAPVYEIKGERPDLSELCDDSKAKELLRNIKNSDLDEDIKHFLEYAAYRHLKFNYSKIAEFYAHLDKNTQQLFEDSALVIIDFNSAIKNGFTKLSKRIEEMRDEK